MKNHKLNFAIVSLLVTITIAMAWMNSYETAESAPTTLFPRRTSDGFVSSTSCTSCHPDQHASWHRTFHATMTQEATTETVIASFDTVELSTAGQSATLQRRGDEFWVNFVDPAWERAKFEEWNATRDDPTADPFDQLSAPAPRIDAQVVMTTGSHHFQVYWIRSGEGRELWQFPWRYHIAEQRWVHRKDVFLVPPDWRPGMWFRVWNSQCSLCHSTGPQPGENPESGIMDSTRIAELGIACESCHGPGGAHIAYHQRDAADRGDAHDPIVNPTKLSHRRSSEVCGACHSHFRHRDPEFTVHGPQFRPGKNLQHFGALIDPSDSPELMSRFWQDGANRSGGREFSGMAGTACYLKGEIACTHCHSMHESDPNDQLRLEATTNEACLQCHSSIREDLVAHTHHAADSSGSRCYNCHMPHTNYALYKAIRSHHIDLPRVTPLASNSRPNACNLCHLDRSLAWAADHLQQWYGIDSPEFSLEETTTSAGALWSLRGDAGQRVIAAWHLGWAPARQVSGAEWIAPILVELMKDPYAAVRWVAFQSLKQDPRFADATFDFDAQAEVRDAVCQTLLRRWTDLPRRRDRDPRMVLLDEKFDQDLERLQQLLEGRDERPVAGVE